MGIEINKLRQKDIGRRVVYHKGDPKKEQKGRIRLLHPTWVYVTFDGDINAHACHADKLDWDEVSAEVTH